MKKCSSCKLDKLFSEYQKNKSKKDGLNSLCKECQKKVQAAWYQKNKDTHKQNIKTRFDEIKKWFNEYKKTLQCENCGFNHPAALDFHHLNDKDKNVSSIMLNKNSIEKILKEIDKCTVLCSNCHRILHFEEKWAVNSTVE